MSNFIREYTAGRTPIPCAHCNADLKFSTLLERALGFGADALATGHYARIDADPDGSYRLRRGADPAKDQTYFLFSLTQEQLARACFPVGDLDKDRSSASTPGASSCASRPSRTARRSASCPMATTPRSSSAQRLSSRRPGALVDRDGAVVGAHEGVHRFTIGQRKGLGLSAREPLYVLEIRPDTSEVVVGPREALGRHGADRVAGELGVRDAPPTDWTPVTAQIRHRHTPRRPACARSAADRAELEFDEAADRDHARTGGGVL